MNLDMDHEESVRYLAARERVEQLRGFYVHLTVYILVNLFLVGINMATDPDDLWFYWPLIGWGIGLGAHAMTVFVFHGRLRTTGGHRHRFCERHPQRERGVVRRDWEQRIGEAT